MARGFRACLAGVGRAWPARSAWLGAGRAGASPRFWLPTAPLGILAARPLWAPRAAFAQPPHAAGATLPAAGPPAAPHFITPCAQVSLKQQTCLPCLPDRGGKPPTIDQPIPPTKALAQAGSQPGPRLAECTIYTRRAAAPPTLQHCHVGGHAGAGALLRLCKHARVSFVACLLSSSSTAPAPVVVACGAIVPWRPLREHTRHGNPGPRGPPPLCA